MLMSIKLPINIMIQTHFHGKTDLMNTMFYTSPSKNVFPYLASRDRDCDVMIQYREPE